MKTKQLFLLLFSLMLSCSISAVTNPLRLKSGSLAPLKITGGTICCVFDFSECETNDKPLELYLTEDYGTSIEMFNRELPDMKRWFMERWDDDIEKGPRATENNDAPFLLKFRVLTLQMGSKSGSSGASISGYAEFYRQGEEQPFAVVEMLKIWGTQMRVPVAGYIGLRQCFNDAAEYLCDLIYKK